MLTERWAVEEGFDPHQARAIAAACLGFDRWYPARASAVNITRHFSPGAWLWSARYLRLALVRTDLELLGYALHCAQDAVAHGTLGEKHLLALWFGARDPDSWHAAPPGVRRRIESVSRALLRRYLLAG